MLYMYVIMLFYMLISNSCSIKSNRLFSIKAIHRHHHHHHYYHHHCCYSSYKLYSSSSNDINATISNNIVSVKPYITSGLLAVHKPISRSSADIVSKIRYILTTGISEKTGLPRKKCKVKVGHGGTLDPLAEGVLILGVGDGTKLLQDYLSGSKNYHAIAQLGSETDTLDNTGNVTEVVDWTHINRQKLGDTLEKFRGDIMQIPPMFSALRKDGKRLYELAREGKTIELEPRPVTVYSLELLDKNKNGDTIDLPFFGLDISCSGGFYVRSVISDIAKSVETRAHMTALLRTKQGPFELNDCLQEQDWSYDKINAAIVRCSKKVGLDKN